jgi:hypothetical protein
MQAWGPSQERSFVRLLGAFHNGGGPFIGRFLGVETTADWAASEPNPQVGSLAPDTALPPPNLPPAGGGARGIQQRIQPGVKEQEGLPIEIQRG